MKLLIIPVAALLLAWSFQSCKSSSTPATFCDTCSKDSLIFTGNHPLKPYVYISAKDCKPDSIGWGAAEYGSGSKSSFADLVKMPITINKDQFKCVFKDTSYAWLLFSDCYTGRFIQIYQPLAPSGRRNIRKSGINSFDPKFSIADGLIAYSDKGNIFVEELATDKKAMMTFGEAVDIDYDVIHEKLDSVNITPTRIWAKVMIGTKWKELQKSIELK